MSYFDTHKINFYKQPKKVELRFLKSGDVVKLYDVGDFDVNITAVILNYKIHKKDKCNELEKEVVMSSGEIQTLYSFFYETEPVFEVVGYVIEKNKNNEEDLTF